MYWLRFAPFDNCSLSIMSDAAVSISLRTSSTTAYLFAADFEAMDGESIASSGFCRLAWGSVDVARSGRGRVRMEGEGSWLGFKSVKVQIELRICNEPNPKRW